MILIPEALKRSVSGSVFSSWEGGLMNDCFSSIDRGNRFLKKGKPPPIELSYAYDRHSRGKGEERLIGLVIRPRI